MKFGTSKQKNYPFNCKINNILNILEDLFKIHVIFYDGNSKLILLKPVFSVMEILYIVFRLS